MKEFTYRFTEILTSYFSKLETIFPLNFSSSLGKCYMGISVYKSYRVS